MKVTSLICTCQNEASYFFIVTKCYYRLKNMKIGDRVRFLSDVGGGIIKGFQGKNIVLVEDEDGFQMPVLATDVVVVTTDDYNIAKVDTMGRNQKPQAVAAPPSAKATDNNHEADEEDIDCILKYFSTIDRFIYMARKFYGRSLEEIIAMIG